MINSINQLNTVSRTGSVGGDDQKKLNTGGMSPVSASSTKGFDSLEISEEALKLRAEAQNGSAIVRGSESETARIKNNISSGFYNNPSVQRAVASKISQLLPGSES